MDKSLEKYFEEINTRCEEITKRRKIEKCPNCGHLIFPKELSPEDKVEEMRRGNDKSGRPDVVPQTLGTMPQGGPEWNSGYDETAMETSRGQEVQRGMWGQGGFSGKDRNNKP